MPFDMILAYVPEMAEREYSDLRLKEAAQIARERDQQAATDLLLDCNPNLFELCASPTLLLQASGTR